MAETIITNVAEVNGTRADEAITFYSNPVSVVLIDGLSATKTADKTHWVNGPLNYSVVVTNNSGEDFTIGVFNDEFDPLTTLDYDVDVTINGSPAPFQYSDHELSVILPAIADGASVTVAFAVKRA